MRESCVRLLFDKYKKGGWTQIKEDSILYTFDVTKVMFSSGNLTEKRRVAKLCSKNEIVLDAYAGIG